MLTRPRGASIDATPRTTGPIVVSRRKHNGHGPAPHHGPRTTTSAPHGRNGTASPAVASAPLPAPPPPTELLVVDEVDVCLGPLVAHHLQRSWRTGAGWLAGVRASSAGLAASSESFCPEAAARVGLSSSAAEEYRPRLLTETAARSAGVLLTVSRPQRTAVIRLAPGVQMKVFTCVEAELLAQTALERIDAGDAVQPADLAALARLLHATRGFSAELGDAVRAPAHRGVDPLTLPSGHGAAKRIHSRAIEHAYGRASALAVLLESVGTARTPG